MRLIQLKGNAISAPSSHFNWAGLLFTVCALLLGPAIAVAVNKIGIWALLIIPIIILGLAALASVELVLLGSMVILYTNVSTALITLYSFPSIAKLVVGGLIAVLLIRRFGFGERFDGWGKAALLLGIFNLIGAFSLLYAADFNVALTTLTDYIKEGLIGLTIVMTIRSPKMLRRLIWAFLVAGLIMGTISTFQQITGTFNNLYWGFGQTRTASDVGIRLEGPISDPNFYAQILVCLIPLAIERIWNEKMLIMRLLAVWAAFVCTYALIFTYSRGGFIALLMAAVLLLVRRPPRPLVAALVVIALVFSIQILPSTFVTRLSSVLSFFPSATSGGMTDTALVRRSSENIVALQMFGDHPIFGIGLGNYNLLYQDYSRQLGLDSRRTERSAHSLYLETAAERGLVGLLALFAILFITYRDLYYAEKSFLKNGSKELADVATAVAVALAGYLFAAIFLHDAFQGYLWIWLGVSWAVAKVSRQLPRNDVGGVISA